jgi:hypothetical protein
MRVPNGGDQEAIAELNPLEAEAELLLRCLKDENNKHPSRKYIQSLNDDEIYKVETALDELAPDVGTSVETNCPECGFHQIVEFDPYYISGVTQPELYEDVHTLAMHYHWNEQEVLALPRERRHFYVKRIEATQRLHT